MRTAPLPHPSPPQTPQARHFINPAKPAHMSSGTEQRQLSYKVVKEKLGQETSVTKTLKDGKDSPPYLGSPMLALVTFCPE